MGSRVTAHASRRFWERTGCAANEHLLFRLWDGGRPPSAADFRRFPTVPLEDKVYRVCVFRGRHLILVQGISGAFITVIARRN